MPDYIINKNALSEFVTFLSQEYELWAPIQKDSKVEMALALPENIVWEYSNTNMSPKGAFFPQTERLMAFHNNKEKENYNVYQDLGQKELKPSVMLGIRPCDSRGLIVANKVFQNDRYSDPYWKNKYEACTFIGLACLNPCGECFCSQVGGNPFGTEGLDIISFYHNDDLALRTVTAKGEELLTKVKAKVSALKEADHSSYFNDLKKVAEDKISTKMPRANIDKQEIMELFEAEHWQNSGATCLNCGICTFICPTCHCFDIQDETTAQGGVRMRNWDTCMSWLFTKHGSGHNPRPHNTDRVRQRFMHKLKYIPLKQEGTCGCIGCGRCVTQCPVNIDIREIAKLMNG